MKKRKLKQAARKKSKVWTRKKADTKFSLFIRLRDGKCVRCGKTDNLQCSHFWWRGNSATRYDPENCDTLCYACHYGNAQGWEYAKQSVYRDFKLAQLGEEKYKKLEERAKSAVKLHDAILDCIKLLGAI